MNQQIPTKLGLIDSMSKFFTPSSSQRHHDTYFTFINHNNKLPSPESLMSTRKQLMAKKILKRNRNITKRLRASSLPSREIKTPEELAQLNLSDKENQQNQTRFKNLSKSFSPTIITLHSPKNTISPKKSPVLLSSKLKKQAELLGTNKKAEVILKRYVIIPLVYKK